MIVYGFSTSFMDFLVVLYKQIAFANKDLENERWGRLLSHRAGHVQ